MLNMTPYAMRVRIGELKHKVYILTRRWYNLHNTLPQIKDLHALLRWRLRKIDRLRNRNKILEKEKIELQQKLDELQAQKAELEEQVKDLQEERDKHWCI